MDKLYNKIRVIFLGIACLLATVFFVAFSSDYAFASDNGVESITAVVSADIEDGVVIFTRGEISDLQTYAKDVEINYLLSDARFYSVDVSVDGGASSIGQLTAVPDDGKVTFPVTQNGKVTVTLNCYDETRNKTEEIVTTVFSDNLPVEVPQSVGMENYCGKWDFFEAFINTEGTDLHSGVGEVYYAIGNGEVLQTDGITGITAKITEKTSVFVYFFDNAKNCIVKEYVYDKFDYTPPEKPIFRVTPDSDLSATGGFASSYNVEIDYGVDHESGIAKKYYSVNGETFREYTADFKLNKETPYTIAAYSVDGVGNTSEKAEYVFNGKIDAVAPVVYNLNVTYDLTAEKLAKLTVEVRDTGSGADRVAVYGTDLLFTQVSQGLYELDIDCYDLSSLVLNIYDKVGNMSTAHVIFNFFGEKEISENIRYFAEWYKTADLSQYGEKAVSDLKDKLSEIGVMLGTATATKENFNAVFAETRKKIDGKNSFVYTLESVPTYLSGALTFEANDTDFTGFLKGEEIKLTFTAKGNDNLFVKNSGFDKGFSENFSLKITCNGEDVETLQNGLKIYLNMPVGFYERQYVLFDADTGEKLAVNCINNKIEFTLKKSTNLSLVISGKSQPIKNEPSKGISVFGRKIKVGTFFGVIGGGIVFVALAIAIIVTVSRRRR